MYRDNTLMPAEAVRLAALGHLATHDATYADVAGEVRQFAARVVGPNLDILGSSIELLRHEGLIDSADGADMGPKSQLRITDAGRESLLALLSARVRVPVEGINKYVLALKMRYLHLLDSAARAQQLAMLIEASEQELARIEDMADRYADELGHLASWIAHDRGGVEARIAWLKDLAEA